MNPGEFRAHGGELKNLIKTFVPDLNYKLVSLPRINLNSRQIHDLELLLNGGFSPLTGFLGENDYYSVIENMRLANGILWSIPVVLDMPDKKFKIGDEVILCDEYGNPLAILYISSVYEPDKLKEARLVFGTTDYNHPGVRCVMESGPIYIGGEIHGLNLPKRYDFVELRKTPRELQLWFKENNWDKVIAFQTRNPIHRAHFEMIAKSAELHQAKVLIHPVVGPTKDGDIDYITRVKTYKIIHEKYAKDFATLSLLPLAMRMGGPREALLHAIIRKNYGCTHFIVGRDHAGPGKDSSGKPFYGAYDAQNLLMKYAEEIGMIIVPFQEMVYVVEEKKYIPINQVRSDHAIKNISGSEVRKMLDKDEKVPEWFSFPEVVAELKKALVKERTGGFTIFFTGLPCSGKSTIANVLYSKLLEIQDKKITFLDGDIIRQNLSRGLGFSKEDRNLNIKRIGFVANEVTKHGGLVICAAIAPYKESRIQNRNLISENGDYIEVYLSTPIEVCKERDVKGLYRKAEAGEIKNFTGVDDPYEASENAEIILDTINSSPEECAEIIIQYLNTRGFLYKN